MIVLMLLLRNTGSERHFVHVINRPKVLLLCAELAIRLQLAAPV
jgi:hypothetical protein